MKSHVDIPYTTRTYLMRNCIIGDDAKLRHLKFLMSYQCKYSTTISDAGGLFRVSDAIEVLENRIVERILLIG